MTAARKSTGGYWPLLRDNRDYRYLWLGQVVSLLGDWFNLIASAALIAALTQSGLAIGSLFVVRMLAPFLVSPIAGVVADRYNRKHILILADLCRAVVVLGFLLVREPHHVWLLYVLSAIQLGLSGFFFPTRTAIVPDIVSTDQLGAANIIGSTTWSVMLAAGAALGGVVAGTWGNQTAFVLDALTFVVSAILIAVVRYRRPPDDDAEANAARSILGEYVAGLQYLRHNTAILLVSLHKGVSALLIASGMQVVQVTIARQLFVIGEGGSLALGLMYAMAGVGTGVGPIVARRFTGDRPRHLGWALTIGYVLSGIGMLAIASLSSFGVVLFGVLLRGLGGGVIWVFSTQLLFQMLPSRVRGRVFGMEFAAFSLMSAIGAAVSGAALDADLGLSQVVVWMAGLTLLPALLWSLWMVARGSLREE